MAGAIVLPFPGAPAIPVPAPVQLFPPLPFTIPGEGNPTADPCRIMADATVDGTVLTAATVAAAPKSSEVTLAAAAEPNPYRRWYDGFGVFPVGTSGAFATVRLNGLASPTLGSGDFFDGILFDSHIAVQVHGGLDPATCEMRDAPRVQRIDIEEAYDISGRNVTMRDHPVLNSHCTHTSLCRRNWTQVGFTAPVSDGTVTLVRHYVHVTVTLAGRPPIELPPVPGDWLEW